MLLTKTDKEFYYPNRYTKARPFLLALAKKYQSIDTKGDDFQKLYKDYYDGYGKELKQEHLPLIGEGYEGLLKTEFLELLDYLSFYKSGSNIFHFSESLLEMFKKTDVDEVKLSNLKLPYKNLYLSFGGQKDLKLTYSKLVTDFKKETSDVKYETVFIDGVYILSNHHYYKNNKFKLVFTTVNNNNDYKKNWKIKRDVPKEFPFYIDATVREKIHYYNIDFDEETTIGQILSIIDKSQFDEPVKDENAENEFKLISQDAFKLVFNSLCYLTVYHEKDKPIFTTDIPNDFKRKIEKKGNQVKELRKIQNELTVFGYSKIKFLGSEYDNIKSGKTSASTVKPHWRRGHWRNQVFGPNRQEHKLLWIQPTIVKNNMGDPENGKIYSV